jgi:type II secretory pathway pseudopilin PulG
MKPLNSAGFTIIEVVLFLGISGLLFFALMLGTGNSINTQRYLDSVTSLQSVLQKQFSEVSNVVNDSATVSCNGLPANRGQSDCVVLGRFVTAVDDKDLVIKDVIGHEPPVGTTIPPDDISALSLYNIQVVNTNTATYELEWGVSLSDVGSPVKSKRFSMLILRSPTSGVVRTFLNASSPNPTPEASIQTLLTVGGNPPTALKIPVILCVNPNGLTGDKTMAVSINANATGPSSIESLGDGDARNTCL